MLGPEGEELRELDDSLEDLFVDVPGLIVIVKWRVPC